MTRSLAMAKLAFALGKVGAYYRGLELLYVAIMDSRLNKKYQALIIRHASPELATSDLYSERYKSVDVIYYRHIDQGGLISPSDVVIAFTAINDYHSSWAQPFVRHAETCLINYLSSLKRRSSDIGISKLFCRACDVWIKAVNKKKLVQNGRRDIWTVSGTHGKNYTWARDPTSGLLEAELSVLQDLYGQIADTMQSMKTNSDNESEEGEMGRVRSDAADLSKELEQPRNGERKDVSFVSGES